MSAAEQMREELNRTGCYRLTGETPGDWELNAMGQELDLLHAEVETLLHNLFLTEPEERFLTACEESLAPQRVQATPAVRARMLRARAAISPACRTLQQHQTVLAAAGVYGSLVEQDGTIAILYGGFPGGSRAQAEAKLQELMPAQVSWQLVPTAGWLKVEASGGSFSEWDKQGLTWTELDLAATEPAE